MNRKPYPTDLTDEQWEEIRLLFPKRRPDKPGRRRKVDRREILNALFYLLSTGCQWRHLPHDFPPWGTVASQFHRWRVAGLWPKIHDALHARARVHAGRQPKPTAGAIDTQSVKTTEAGGPRGFDGGKKVNGRKRHLVVDTLGLLIAVAVQPASTQDYDGAEEVVKKAKERFPRLKLLWADSRYGCKDLPLRILCLFRILLEIVTRPVRRGWVLLKRRWVVERTFAWLGRSRRLSKDYERNTKVSEVFLQLSMIRLMLNRLRPRET